MQAVWDPQRNELFLWAESAERLAAPNDAQPPAHPFAAPFAALDDALRPWELPPLPHTSRTLTLPTVNGPTVNGRPLHSPSLGVREADDSTLLHWDCPGAALSASDAFLFLSAPPETQSPGVWLDDSTLYFREATKFLLDLLTRGRFLPGIARESNQFFSRWFTVVHDAADLARFAVLTESMPRLCRALDEPGRNKLRSAREVLQSFLAAGTDYFVRLFLRRMELDPGSERPRATTAKRWLLSLNDAKGELDAPVHELVRLDERFRLWSRSFLASGDSEHVRTGFRLVAPQGAHTEEWIVELLLCADSDAERSISGSALWAGELGPFQNRDTTREELENRFLRDLGQAVSVFAELRRSLTETYPSRVRLTTEEAYQFLRTTAEALEGLGFFVLLPLWWRRPNASFGLSLSISSPELDRAPSARLPVLGTGQLLDFSWHIALGDRELSREEFEGLVRRKSPLIRFQDQWVELDPKKADATLEFLREQERRDKLSFLEALHIGLGADEHESILPMVGLRTSGWIRRLLDADQHVVELMDAPNEFAGSLRPYQREGLSWLSFRLQLGIGACLADDMGLGKTVQFLALVLAEKLRRHAAGDTAPRPMLLVVPMSILANWEHEIRRFAPTLTYLVHHGAQRLMHESFVRRAHEFDLIITTYSLAFRDEDFLTAVPWLGIALDEAQNIKNIEAKQTRSIRRLCHLHLKASDGIQPFYRMALTGTPLENHLQELWSIFDFLNPGILGTLQSFRSRFALPIERFRSKEASSSLSRLLKPFVLRRVKSDPRVISDLPEKIEMQELIPLTHEQAALYQAALEEMLPQVEAARGMHRKGLVLATITKLKQICDHPSLFLKDGSDLGGRSHKINRLEELLEEIIAEGDRVLVFTQFAQMGHLLQPYLQQRLRQEVLFLHGGLARAAREKTLQRFQAEDGPPVFLLSLKAGGFGLNLTQANQVIHLDQWWNPAVEDQATDRVYRIGQRRNVQVRKLICQGTLEERIGEMLKQKRELAMEIVGSTKDSITQLSTDELRRLLELAPASHVQASELMEAEDE